MISPRCRREGDSPLRRRGCSAKPSRSSREVFAKWFVKHSRCLHEAFTQWAHRGAFAKGSRRLHGRFVKTSRALKASRRDREAFAKPSRRLHPSPRRLRGAFLKASRGARGVFIWKRLDGFGSPSRVSLLISILTRLIHTLAICVTIHTWSALSAESGLPEGRCMN